MGLFDRSSSSNQTDSSQDSNDVASGDWATANQGTFAEDSELSNISGGFGGNVEITLLDNEAIDAAFSATESATESIEDVTRASFDAFKSINDNSNDLIKSSLKTVSDAINKALTFASDSEKAALDAISETTGDQSSLFSQSLQTVQSGVASSLTSGNTDIIKLVMMGLVGFGLVFALMGKS